MYLKRKYQVGGAVAYTPYISSSAPATQPSGGSSEDKSDKISGTITKEIADILKESGIPVDVDLFLNTADNFLRRSRALSGTSLFGGSNTDYSLSDLIKVQKLANDVKYNNKLREAAGNTLTKEHSGAEVAITSSGYIYAVNEEGKIEKLTPSEFHEKEGEVQALTNNQLMYMREHSADFAFDTNILNDISNSVGMTTIMKTVVDTIGKFKAEKEQGYTTKTSSKVDRGMQFLMEGGPDGYYKFTNENERKDVAAALNYLYKSLTPYAQHLLKAKTAVEGGDPSKASDVTNLLFQAVLQHTGNTRKVDFDKTASDYDPRQTGERGGSDKNLKEYTYVERLAAGQNSGLPERLAITNENSTVDMNVMAWNVGNIVKNKEEDDIGSGMLDIIRQDAYGLDQVANQSTVQFGDQEFDKNAQSTIYYDNTPMYRTKMPATRNNKGEIVVDWKAVELVNKINENLRDKEYTPEMLQRLLKETDPRLYIDQNGQIAWADDAWFLTFEAVVANNYENNLNIDSPYIQKVSPDEERQLREKYENANKYGYTNPTGKAQERVGRNRKQGQFIINWMNHDLYKSKVFMPITREMAGSSEFYPAATHMDNMNTALARKQQIQTQKELNMGSRKTNF